MSKLNDPYGRFSQTLGKVPNTNEHDSRSPVAKDRDRIIHSGAFRRLQRKSQIVGVQSSDFFRTRLTHTLECSQIARGLAARCMKNANEVVEDPAHFQDLMEAAALAHDLGHAPFGHNGEAALIEMMKCHGNGLFEGNAQSFRIVTSLEPKVLQDDVPCGLDLTRTTLRAIIKYPWTESEAPDLNTKKFCFYNTPEDIAVKDWLFAGAKPKRTIATDLLEAADDIAYAAHDFEDGVWSGLIPLSRLLNKKDHVARGRLEARIGSKKTFAKTSVSAALDELIADTGLDQQEWAALPFDRTRVSRAGLKNYTARLIEMFIEGVTSNDAFKPLETGDALDQRLALLKGMATVWMIERSAEATVRFGQRKLVEDLFEGYWAKPSMLPNQETWDAVTAKDPTDDDKNASNAPPGMPFEDYQVWAAKARAICDHVAGMTDLYALHVHGEMYRGGGPGLFRPIFA